MLKELTLYSRHGGLLLHERFFRLCESEVVLGKTALHSQGSDYTYSDLLARVEQIAGSLEARGVGHGDLVALRAERSFDAVAAIYAIMSLGAVYLPIDRKLPEDRVRYMFDISECRWLLTDQPVVMENVDVLDLRWCDGPQRSCSFDEISPDDLAYVIFTSGSTGRPKGVMITHGSSSALIGWVLERFSTSDMACVLGATSFSFDISILELFGPLACGGSLCLVNSIIDLADNPCREKISLINTVPSAMSAMLTVAGLPSSVRACIFVGEPLYGGLSYQVYEQGVDRVFNLYGPTEDTVYSTEYLVARDVGEDVPIGRPLPGTDFAILDEQLEPVQEGEPGELCLFGIGLAKGYFNQPDLTAQRFLPCPSGRRSGQVMYRTGDRVRQLPDGNLHYVGRLDDQIKLHGHRIELMEVASVIGAVPGVSQASVQVKDLSRKRDGSRKGLVAYYTWASENHSLAEAVGMIKAQVASHLPSYMHPLHYLHMEVFPLTNSGKLDKNKLPNPVVSADDDKSDDPVSSMFQEVLGSFDIPENETLFDLGGVSLDLVRIVAELRRISGRVIMLKDAFGVPTIRGLRKLLSQASPENAVESIPDEPSVLAAQSQMWLSMQMADEPAAYRLFAKVCAKGVSAESLENAFRQVIQHHIALHTEITLDGAGLIRRPISKIGQAVSRTDDVGNIDDGHYTHWLDLHMKAGCPLTVIIAQDEGSAKALVIADHTSFDHWSLGVLEKHLDLVLSGEPLPVEKRGQRSPLVPTRDDCFILRNSESLANSEPVQFQPDYSAGMSEVSESSLVVGKPLAATVIDTVKRIASAVGISQVGVMLSAFADVVSQRTGATCFSVGVALADRYPGNYEVIDCRVNTLPIVVCVDGEVSQIDRLKGLGSSLFDLVAYSHLGIKPILERARALRGEPKMTPFSIAFGAHNARGSTKQCQVEASFLPNPTSRLDLTLWIDEQPNGYVAVWNGKSGIFSEKALESWHQAFITRLKVISHLTEVELRNGSIRHECIPA
ncbi:amino acid adenylation domain-containing protein [Spartinivicinus ruber]|uniref:amino acid adenylation domain-containing protein n=1 Tax=Spartinivicinus ruber TaxID=2683272 RepID=UPI0013D5FA29|nr:amino acid adenylation domain-containing protein [Spartinivicinus ruber]